jgi:NAD(P)-dependent dehydrogenase (short-subunit alcohol dehydrogenase family)
MSAAAPGRSSTALQVVAGHDLTGMETIVTGGASGLGYETSRALVAAGARVVVAGRDQARGEQAVRALREDTGNGKIVFRPLDLASLESVTTWARRHSGTGKPCHILVLNAGVMAPPLTRTAEGFELQFGVNYLARFVFALGLLPSLRAAGTARVVSVSSSAHRRSDIDFGDPNYLHRPYDPWQAYGQSKTACALLSAGLTARHRDQGITCNAVLPGAIRTGLQRNMSQQEMAARDWDVTTPPGWKTPGPGAATTIWAAVASELDGIGGAYLEDCAIARPWTKDEPLPAGHYLPYALDPEHSDRLWHLAEQLTAPYRSI